MLKIHSAICLAVSFSSWRAFKHSSTAFARACPHFTLSQIKVQARNTIALKLRANFSKRVAILRKCLSLAKRFSTKWRSLYRYESNSGLGFLLLHFLGITGLMPRLLTVSRIASESYPLSAIKCCAPLILSMRPLAAFASWTSPPVISKSIGFPCASAAM